MRGANADIIIQERDRHLLKELATFRVVDREQAKIIGGFNSTTRVNTRLLALTKAGLLRRFFLGATEASKKAVYSLSPKGALLAVRVLRRLRNIQRDQAASWAPAHAPSGRYCLGLRDVDGGDPSRTMRDRRLARSTEPWTWAGPSSSAKSPRPTESNQPAGSPNYVPFCIVGHPEVTAAKRRSHLNRAPLWELWRSWHG
jgi:hypothetical protein